MTTFDELVGKAAGPAAESDLATFVVPPRFADASFESYRPDPRFRSQSAARERVAAAVRLLQEERGGGGGLLSRFWRRPNAGWHGLYLDGGFGVGKTHLLASAWHAAGGLTRAYLSFQELTYVVGALGMARTLELLGATDLVCLDEFELDDPGNTMLATSFVRGALERGARVIATSNTLPNELGGGRFSADEFQREIGQLAASFSSVRIDGEDYRHRRFSGEGPPARLLSSGVEPSGESDAGIPWSALLDGLARVHPIQYSRIAARLPGIWLQGVRSLPDQDTALRFVHFADKLYDYRIPLVISGDATLADLFPATFGYGPFERKFRRCCSRLFEMLSEPLPATATARVLAADD